jgi:hypothetical protein
MDRQAEAETIPPRGDPPAGRARAEGEGEVTADNKPSADTFRQKEYVAIGYIVDARSYLDAARLIESVEEHQPALSSPIYFLLCHAIELF